MVPRNDPFTPRDPQRALPQVKAGSPAASSLADDEDSCTFSSSQPNMEEHHDFDPLSPQYPGEDVRLTSSKELSGWYIYGWAAEVFVICGIGSFVPITLEQLARDQGYLLSDRSKPCSAPAHVPMPSTSSSSRTSSAAIDNSQCIVSLSGADINTASFAMYTFSISVLVQALLIISMSGAADHGLYRKSFLLSFAFTGAVATMLFLVVVPKIYVFGALLAIVANTCFGASFVLLNSYLPVLVRRHPSIKTETEALDYQHASGNSRTRNEHGQQGAADPLLQAAEVHQTESRTIKTPISPALQLSTKISSYGIGIGYIAAVIVQTAGIVIVLIGSRLTTSSTLILRAVLFFIGSWWFAFSIPAALWLRPRPGPPLPFSGGSKQRGTWSQYISYAWGSLFQTLLRARRLKNVMLFLTAWFLLSDSIATVSGTAVLFAKTELHMPTASLALISLIGTLTGVVGAFSWSKISQWSGLSPSQTITACICLFELIPLYGLLGYIPAVQRFGTFGLQQPWEMYPIAGIYGFVLGGLSSYCRSLYGELIPPGSEAAFYALYAITDKGSSVFGPAIVGIITDRYGEIRPAFIFLAVLIFIPLPIMLLVEVDVGRREGAALAREIRRSDARSTTPDDDSAIRLIDDEVNCQRY